MLVIQKRVDGVISNSLEFSKAFNCKPGQNNNPINKCKIWWSTKIIKILMKKDFIKLKELIVITKNK